MRKKNIAVIAAPTAGFAAVGAAGILNQIQGPEVIIVALITAGISAIAFPGIIAAANQVWRLCRTAMRKTNPDENTSTITAMAAYLISLAAVFPAAAAASLMGMNGGNPLLYLPVSPICAMAAWLTIRRLRKIDGKEREQPAGEEERGGTRGTDPGWTDPGWTDPGWTDPGWTDPGWTDPGWTNQRGAESHHGFDSRSHAGAGTHGKRLDRGGVPHHGGHSLDGGARTGRTNPGADAIPTEPTGQGGQTRNGPHVLHGNHGEPWGMQHSSGGRPDDSEPAGAIGGRDG